MMDAESRTFKMADSPELTALWQRLRVAIWLNRILLPALALLIAWALVDQNIAFMAGADLNTNTLSLLGCGLLVVLIGLLVSESVWARVREVKRMVGAVIRVRNRRMYLDYEGHEYEVEVQDVSRWRASAERGPGGTSLRTLVSGGRKFVIAADLMVEVTEAEDEAEAESVEMNPADSLNNPDLEAESSLQVEV